jgi:hypothetical protein
MFCPQCGSTQPNDLNFCKYCGANLGAVREAVQTGHPPGTIDWNKTWVAEMFASSEESVRRAKEIERLQGITPEIKRRREIKAGVIVSSVGVGVMVFLYFLMEGIILSGDIKPGDEFILSRVWLAGVIPFLVGLALIINGALVSRPDTTSEASKNDEEAARQLAGTADEYLPPADTNDLFPADFSVTDETTRHLEEVPAARSKTAKRDQ